MKQKPAGLVNQEMNPFQNSGNDTSKSTSIVKWAGGVLGTGQILAHELAHGMGVKHDFETHRGRSWTCGPSRDEDGGAIMNYGTPKGSVWSRCTRRDFENYMNRVMQNLPNFCLSEFTGECHWKQEAYSF